MGFENSPISRQGALVYWKTKKAFAWEKKKNDIIRTLFKQDRTV